MADDEYVWPGDLPDDCPPASAAEADLVVYRFIKKDPPHPDDFLRPVDKPRKQAIEPEEMCSMCALSVFAEPSDIPVARKFIPGFKKKAVAEARLSPGEGVVEHSPIVVNASPEMRSHHDWWVPEGLDPLPKFAVVEL